MRLFTFLLLSLLATAGLRAQAPSQVLDIFPGMENSSPTRFFNYGDKVLFRADTPDEGVELWITDGTAAGTNLVKDINDDPTFRAGNSNPNNFTEYNGLVYFTATGAGTGSELWVTDGTEAGTNLVLDIQPGEGNGNPFDFILYNDLMYFTANNGNDANSSELWSSDGTAEGTQLVVDIFDGGPGNPINKFEYLGLMFFAGNDGVNGRELWFTDGTAEGTNLFFDINPGEGNSNPSNFFDFGGRLIFSADNGTLGSEPYNFNAVANSIGPIFDLVDGEDGSRPSDFFSVGSTVFFSADSDQGDDGLHLVDFAEGQILINIINQNGPTNPRQLTEIVPNRAYVMVVDTGATEDQSDFLLIENLLQEDLNIEFGEEVFEPLGGADPEDLIFTGSSLYFTYETAETGRELAGIDLFNEGELTRFGEIIPGAEGGSIDEPILLGTQLLFEASDNQSGRELWAVDVNAATINLETEDGETIAFNDTLDFGTVDFGVLDSIVVVFNNTGNTPGFLFDGSASVDTEILIPLIENTVDDDQLPAGPDNALIKLLLLPQEEGPFLDTLSVGFTTSSGPSTVRFLIRGNVVAPGVTVFAEDERILRNDTLSFIDTEAGVDSTRTLTFNNDGEGNYLILSVELAEGSNFSIPENVSVSVGPGETYDLPVTYTGNTGADVVMDSLIVQSNIGEFVVILDGSSLTVSVVDRGLPAKAVYPNPTSGSLRLELEAPVLNGEWRITNSIGQVVSRGVWPAGQAAHDVDLSAFATGAYQVEVISGERRLTARVIKK